MIIMSIDPGVHAGCVAYNFTERRLIHSATLIMRNVIGMLRWQDPQHIVIESPPKIVEFSTIYMEHYYKILREYPKVNKILPGLWKPIAKAQKWKFKYGRTKHEKDAYNMMRYWILTKLKTNIGDM
ncbi:hypothetical protein LCGC14_0466410 [marine sediment metagenome]|uniref:YqgF/RNase H-like domain-containing protein n=1 Tax=marine sediment metagenome TaxID=412755 RepID=A0A0F9V0C6_9ZZZZ